MAALKPQDEWDGFSLFICVTICIFLFNFLMQPLYVSITNGHHVFTDMKDDSMMMNKKTVCYCVPISANAVMEATNVPRLSLL